MNNIITEIVEFGVKDGISDKEFLTVSKDLIAFYGTLDKSGYIRTNVIKHEDGLWVMVIDWESKEQEKKASSLMMKSPITENFRNSLDLTRFKKRIFKNVYVS